TFSGYTQIDKVYESTDGGQTWTSIAGSLPNIPVNTIVHDHTTLDGLYIGTDFGVYFRNDTMSDWILFNHGLPNVIVSELEIQHTAGKLRAATFGRGVWETDLYDGINSIEQPQDKTALTMDVYPNPLSERATLEIYTSYTGKAIITMSDIRGRELWRREIIRASSHITETISAGRFGPGVYNVVVSVGEKKIQKQIVIE
ncbi:MAG: T9SS type A sorting domain-containing protein, partial [Flavobacteriales bacterium]